MRRSLLLVLLVLAPFLGVVRSARATLPPGFFKTQIAGPWAEPVGVAFDDNGRMYVWERAGRVWLVENGVKSAVPLIDISDEVGNWGDHGLLGFALHPNFLQNGFIYLFYAVDHYYLQYGGTPGYDPNADDPLKPSIARITRYTAQASTGFRSVDPASRRVLFGESEGSGCPLIWVSHGVGSLVFGADGSLLASCGESASSDGPDTGGPQYGSYTPQALAEGIIRPAEDVGAFRAQMVNSFSGKILRMDPQTGDGLPSNPFYDPANPRAPRSRVFALGFRNPFRFSLRPNTGSHLASDGNPGSLYVGNVGWYLWEEIEVVNTPGYNSGWPIFEGMDAEPDFMPLAVQNFDAPNPLFGIAGCAQPFFRFGDLIAPESIVAPFFPNPCNPTQQVPASIPHFMERRPGLAYGHGVGGPMRTPIFIGTTPAQADVGAPGSPVAGTPIGGFTTVGGVWYTGTDFPPQYRNTFFHGDYGFTQITQISYDASDRPTLVTPFDDDAGFVVMLATSPTKGGLYTVDVGGTVSRISYVPAGNQPPTARAVANPNFGSTPATVAFDGSASTDPEGLPLTFSWNFGDGSPLGTIVNPLHTYFGPLGVLTTYTATLTVRDTANQTSSAQVPIVVNDSPPQVSIVSPTSQGFYSMAGPSSVPLAANISDAEQSASQLTCAWQVSLHRNAQVEPGPIDSNCTTSATLSPLGCDGNAYSYSFSLTVSDGVGLSTTQTVSLYPNCASIQPAICGNLDASGSQSLSDVLRLRAALANPLTNGLSAGELSRCSVIGGAECDVADLTVLRRYLVGFAPGPAPVCPAASP
ncbi:MAG: PQQ-dependent sugar dehydrogenase [Myxococcota bacterium]